MKMSLYVNILNFTYCSLLTVQTFRGTVIPSCWSGLHPEGLFSKEKIWSHVFAGDVKHLLLFEFPEPKIKQAQV